MDLGVLSLAQRPHAQKIVEHCVKSRKYFIKEILGVEYVEPWQEQVLEALDSGETKISVRSGHGVGKTALCSWLAVHFLCFRDDVKVIVTSPSQRQLSDGLNPEIVKWISKMPEWMQASLEITRERISRLPTPQTNFISFRTARKENPEALAGVHATHVMIIVDEASGVEEIIYETGQGALSTKGAIAVLIGNPTRPSGFFYKTQTVLSDLWWTKKVSCLDSSRVDPEYIMSQARTYGVDSREYAVRVLGEFPESGQDSVIPRTWVSAAVGRKVAEARGDIVWGLDPGRGGDPTGFVERSANVLKEYRELKYQDLMQTVGWVKSRWDKIPDRFRPSYIYVDSIGLGAGVADRLLELKLPVVHVNVAEAPAMADRFYRLRDELWHATRAWFESREVRIDPEGGNARQLEEELAAVEQTISSSGRIKVEGKPELKRRGIKSPNLADALCLTFAHGGAVRLGSYTRDVWGDVDTSKYVPKHVV